MLGAQQKKGPTSFEIGPLKLIPATPYSPIGAPYSTIGTGGLNDRVRDGNGCITSAIATGNSFGRQKCPPASLRSARSLQRILVRLRSRPFVGLASGAFLIGLFLYGDQLSAFSQVNTELRF